jgi:hypothetical protein
MKYFEKNALVVLKAKQLANKVNKVNLEISKKIKDSNYERVSGIELFRRMGVESSFVKSLEKTADFAEWWKNRKEDWESLKYLAKHKYYVYKGGRELGADPIALIKHDITKLKPSIWVAYREQFHGGHGRDPETYRTFRKAVAEHAGLESHHDYKYKNTGVPNLENFADWWSVSKSHDPSTPGIKTWLRKRGITY